MTANSKTLPKFEPNKNSLVLDSMIDVIEGISLFAGVALAYIAINGYKKNRKANKDECCCNQEKS
jgi:hypothetical protein